MKNLLGKLDSVLDNNRVGAFATIGTDGRPQQRWMTAALLRGGDGYLYTLTTTGTGKTVEIQADKHVSWLFSDSKFSVRLRGTAELVVNPDLVATVIEAMRGGLVTYWPEAGAAAELAVIETRITSIEILNAKSGELEKADL